MRSSLALFLAGLFAGATLLLYFTRSESKADPAQILTYIRVLEGKEQLIVARTQSQQTFRQDLTDNSVLARILRSLFGPYIGAAQIELQCIVDYNYFVDLDDPGWKITVTRDTLLSVRSPMPKLLAPPGLHTNTIHLSINQRSVFINERDRYDELVRSLSDTLASLGRNQLNSNSAIRDTCAARLEHILTTFARMLRPEIRSAQVSFTE